MNSTFEVDYDHNITALYESITACDWDTAIDATARNPKEAQTWVVRRYDNAEIMWRFLPLHSACARQPPTAVISALLQAYPEGATLVDDQGMYALHYACGNQASRDVIRLLLVAFPGAAKVPDPRGMLPIHYLACWGPSTVSIIDMVLVAHRNVANVADADGNTPMQLAMEGEYPEQEAVVAALKRWFDSAIITDAPTNSTESTLRTVSSFDAKDKAVTTTTAGSGAGATTSTPFNNHDRSSPLTVGRLRQEITKLKLVKKQRDNEWEDRMNVSVGSLSSKNRELVRQVESATNSLGDAQVRLEELEIIVTTKDRRLKDLEAQLQETSIRLAETEQNCDGLRQTLTDVTDAHDKYKRKSEIMSDRIGSLSASLTGMMDQQENLMRTLQSRDARLLHESTIRRGHLQELQDLEDQFYTDSAIDDAVGCIESAFEKQNKEMDAIAAVIAAARS